MNKTNLNIPPGPVIPERPRKELERAIAHAKDLVVEHKSARPSNLDIPAITAWAQDLSVKESNLVLLESQARMGWRDIPVPSAAPSQPTTPPAAVAPKPTPPPVPGPSGPIPSPTLEVPMPRVAKPAREQLQHLLKSLEDQVEKTKSAATRADFIRIRQAAYWKRGQLVKFAKAHKLELPRLPVVPEDPFGTKGKEPVTPQLPSPLDQFISDHLKANPFDRVVRVLGDTQPRTPQERLETLSLALRCLQGLNPVTPLGLPELMGILADYANRAGEAA